MTRVDIDASAGAETVTATARGRALAEQLGASLLTDDHRLIRTPSFPSGVTVLQLPLR